VNTFFYYKIGKKIKTEKKHTQRKGRKRKKIKVKKRKNQKIEETRKHARIFQKIPKTKQKHVVTSAAAQRVGQKTSATWTERFNILG
jgi:hypothetical protein